MGAPALARRLWLAVEPIHALVYFAEEPLDALRGLGLKGFWMGYFASRSAPLGPVAPPVVTATFHGFAPWMVERALPDAWALTTPAAALDARYAGIDRALRRVLGDDVASLAPLVELIRPVCAAAPIDGRALYAAHAALPWPEEPHLALWHATTLLREHRGDGHVAALTEAGIDGCMSQVLQVARGATTRDDLQKTRGWSDDDWVAAEARIVERGITDRDRERVEEVTDTLAAAPLAAVGDGAVERLLDGLAPLTAACAGSGDIRYPNPIGLPPPASP